MEEATAGGMPLDLFLVRHGQSEGNVVLQRSKKPNPPPTPRGYAERDPSNYRLTDKGRAQAERAGRWIRAWMARHGVEAFDRYYCSPFVRTRETAARLALPGAQWQLESLLRERDFGRWGGLGKSETNERFWHSTQLKERQKFLWRPEGGESTADLDMRAREVLATLAREQAGLRVVCVTHEDVMWAFRYRLEKMTIEQWLRHEDDDSPASKIANCGILHFTRRTEAGRVTEKFTRVRNVDPARPGHSRWRRISRPRYTDEQLLAQDKKHPPLDLDPGTG